MMKSFLKRYLKEFLEYMDMDMDMLSKIIDKFRKPLIWKKENDKWLLKHIVKKI